MLSYCALALGVGKCCGPVGSVFGRQTTVDHVNSRCTCWGSKIYVLVNKVQATRAFYRASGTKTTAFFSNALNQTLGRMLTRPPDAP